MMHMSGEAVLDVTVNQSPKMDIKTDLRQLGDMTKQFLDNNYQARSELPPLKRNISLPERATLAVADNLMLNVNRMEKGLRGQDLSKAAIPTLEKVQFAKEVYDNVVKNPDTFKNTSKVTLHQTVTGDGVATAEDVAVFFNADLKLTPDKRTPSGEYKIATLHGISPNPSRDDHPAVVDVLVNPLGKQTLGVGDKGFHITLQLRQPTSK